MDVLVRKATTEDTDFLWQMLYYAAHMFEGEADSYQAAKTNPDLAKYVLNWGRTTDLGSIAMEPGTGKPLGAAWSRLLVGKEKTYAYVNDLTPELAVATLPEYGGRGIGTKLIQHLLEQARGRFEAVTLSVRVSNKAERLYQRLGFETMQEIINRVGTRSLVMMKTLD